MRRLEDGRSCPAGIIVCDIDGLKLVNDAFGYDQGDRLLAALAGILQQACPGRVARVGEDEFALLLPGTTRADLDLICSRIKRAVAAFNRTGCEPPLHASFGMAWVSNQSAKISQLFQEADNNMCREKLHHNRSTRSCTVRILMKLLEARDFITEGHAERMAALTVDLAQVLGLAAHRITDLRLLAQFHDIGKVGIPDRILFKPGALTPEESKEMCRHCEIGYRIAQSSPVLKPIAGWILKHHEWWNGGGYPLGLKGREIPLECRILAIADAYDAMTSQRPYRQALDPAAALGELQRCAGTQFDPRLVHKFIRSRVEA